MRDFLRPLVLTPESAARVLDLLENPRPATPALRALFGTERVLQRYLEATVEPNLQIATFSMSDIRFYEALPAYEPTGKTKFVQSKLGLHPDWRDLGSNRRSSAVFNRGPIIIMAKRDHGDPDVEVHELGHYFYFEKMDPNAWKRAYTYFRKNAPKYHGQDDWRLIDGNPVFCGRGRDGILETFADLFKLFYQGKLSNAEGGWGQVMKLVTEGGGSVPHNAAVREQVLQRYLIADVASVVPDLQAYLEKFSRKHPKLGRLLPKVVEKPQSGSSEARQHGNEIWLFPKFWKLSAEIRAFVLTHEIGHFVLSNKPSLWLVETGRKYGVDVWDALNLPFGQFNMEEAFADSFASYHLSPGELRSRYPEWLSIVKEAL